MKKKYIYDFGEGSKALKPLLGGKGAGLADMTSLGLPVPPGFTITTETCHEFHNNGGYPKGFWANFDKYLRNLEKKIGKKFGVKENPLLVSVRSGAAISMPGMMDTILNLGLNEETLAGLIKKTKNERFCYDSYRRFIQMFSEVVLGLSHDLFEEAIDMVKKNRSIQMDTQLTTQDLHDLVFTYKQIVKEHLGKAFPEDPHVQLRMAIEAVFNSWNSNRAKAYRKIHAITGLKGTAVNIQSMVFGNMGTRSATGVAFTRNPSTGKKEFYGEFLINAQGEDVVAGIRTPQKITKMKRAMPLVYRQLIGLQKKLEKHYKNMQDIEFTVEEEKLFMLQTRTGKRSAAAALKIAIDMVKEKLITKKEALLQVNPDQLNQLLHPMIAPGHKGKVIAKGLPASPGAASGHIVFSPEAACEWAEKNSKVILVRKETSPEDIQGMFAAEGILTSKGGMTSHAAVVCRGMGKSCVAGCNDVHIDKVKKTVTCGDVVLKEGEIITLNGSTGEVILGEVPLVQPKMGPEFKQFMKWVDEFRTIRVRTNADTPEDSRVARGFGAEGIGLCRTEHMFFAEDRIARVREMILAKDEAGRKSPLQDLLPMQKNDFVGIFKEMDGYPVTIRLLDPPLHEFLPTTPKQILDMAHTMGIDVEEVNRRISQLHEINPMLGHRGCRLAVTYPDIYEMQVRAILEAACEVSGGGKMRSAGRGGKKIIVLPEIEIPFVGIVEELKSMRAMVESIIKEFGERITFPVKIGTMIELPRACLVADEIAAHADFFSFGTNDLTQMTYGISRDDAGKFLAAYMEQGILEKDPTATIDQAGVGKLMKMCIELGRGVKPKLEIGICGEHGGEAESVEFCHRIGLDYVSCSPYRIPIAKLAAAQAAIRSG